MISGRAGMKAIGLEDAAVQLKAGIGTRFDPEAATALVAAVRENPGILDSPMGSDAELARFESLFREDRKAECPGPWGAAIF
jgi:hypothetical protein